MSNEVDKLKIMLSGNYHFYDENLSWGAKGLMSFLKAKSYVEMFSSLRDLDQENFPTEYFNELLEKDYIRLVHEPYDYTFSVPEWVTDIFSGVL